MIEHRLPRWDLPREAARLDRAHPFAGRFTSVYLPGISAENLGSGGAGSIVANTHPETIIPAGPALRLSGTAANATFGRSFGPTPSYPLTMVIVCRQSNNTTSTIAALSAASAIGGSYYYIGGGSSTILTLGARNAFGTNLALHVTVPADANGNQAIGQDLVIVAQSLSASDHRICVNGSAIATATTNIGSMSAWDRLFFGQTSGITGLDVAAALFAHGGTALTDAQMRQLSSTPRRVWELFEPHVLRLPVGAAGGGATAPGVTHSASAQLLPGSASGQANATASGVTLAAGAALIAGAATGQISAAASGVTLSAAASLLPGSASGQANATASGATLNAAASLIAGAASGGNAGTAAGVTISAGAALVPGAATGQRNATAAGATIAAAAQIIAGAASGQTSGTAAGVTISAVAALIPGAASAANDGTAPSATLTAGASLIAGAASGQAGAAAPGATLTASMSIVAGGAYGPAAAVTPGFDAAMQAAPSFDAAIGADGRSMRLRRSAA